MSDEKMRDEFEAWISSDWQGVRLVRNPDNYAMFAGQYQEGRVNSMWRAWQASREMLTVELPIIHRDDYANAYGFNCAVEAIDAAQYTVKRSGIEVQL